MEAMMSESVKEVQIEGTVKKVYATRGRWAAFRFEYKNPDCNFKTSVNAAGKVAYEPIEGAKLLLRGNFYFDDKFGEKFDITDSMPVSNKAGKNVIDAEVYLKSGLLKGIGPTIADRILEMFGEDKVMDILSKHPEKLLKVKGITPKKLKTIKECHNQHYVLSEILDYFKGNITENQLLKIHDKYGENAIQIIRKNPYRLIYDIDGFGFRKVDALAMASGIKADSPARIGAAMFYGLVSAQQEGHCFLDINSVETRMVELIHPYPKWVTTREYNTYVSSWVGENKNKFSAILRRKHRNDAESMIAQLDDWHEKKSIIFDNILEVMEQEVKANHIVLDDDGRIYTKDMYLKETGLAELLWTIMNGDIMRLSRVRVDEAIAETEKEQGITLEDAQRRSVYLACTQPVSIITGGPGTGKTTIIKAILKAFKETNCYLLAPTGRAAQRMTESTGMKADTAHHYGYTKRYAGNEIPDWPHKHIFLDESSMADLSLMYAVFSNMEPGDSITLIGDINQLPSIGPGNVLRDLIYSRHIPTTKLTFTHRFGGSIGLNAELINNGANLKKLKLDDDFHFEEITKEEIAEKVIKKYLNLVETNSLKDICCLVPVRKKGKSASAVELLNEKIRETLNPKGTLKLDGMEKKEYLGFREGDRVMQMSNNYEKVTWVYNQSKEDTMAMGIYNGETGFVEKADVDSGIITVRLDDDRCYEINSKETESLTLAYVSTIHKSQGSQYKIVMIVHSNEHKYMLNKNLFYTAVTRAKNTVYLMGDESAFSYAVYKEQASDRNTHLITRIEDVYAERKNKAVS